MLLRDIELLFNREPEELYHSARTIREKTLGKEVHIRALLEFSNCCQNNCLYCGLRKNNRLVQRYQLSKEAIISLAKKADQEDYGTIVLQSGEYEDYTEELTEIIQEIKSKTNLAITLSLGEHSKDTYVAWRKAGADRYLLKIETTNENLYSRLRPECSLRKRISCLYNLRELGYQVGSGIIIGLPGQTIDDITRDLLFLKELDVEMLAIGPLIPHKNTPLNMSRKGSLELTLKTIAIGRIMLPYAHIPATTALRSLDSTAQAQALAIGANVLMLGITPKQFKEYYQIYPTSKPMNLASAKELIESLGYTVGEGKGHSPKSPWKEVTTNA